MAVYRETIGLMSVSYTHLDVYKRQDGYQVDPWGAWMTEEGTQTKTMDRELTGIPLGMALLSDSTLVNKWSDYRLLIPPDSDISIVSEYRDEEARGQNYYDIGTAATAEYGGYSLFIWYHKDNDPQIPAGDQMRKHNYDLIHEYRYPGPFVETERVIGGHGFSGFKYKAWGYGLSLIHIWVGPCENHTGVKSPWSWAASRPCFAHIYKEPLL